MEKEKQKTEEKEETVISMFDAFIEALVNISLSSKVMAKRLMMYQIQLMEEESKCAKSN